MPKPVAASRRFGGVAGSSRRRLAAFRRSGAAALAAALLAGQPAAAANPICSDRDALLAMIAATQAVERASPDAPAVDLARILNEAGGKLVRLEDDASIEPSLLSLRRQFVMNYRTLRVALAREGTQGAQAYLADREVQAIASVLEAVLNATDCGAGEGEGPKEDGAATADSALTGRRPELRLREGSESAADDAGPRFDPTAFGALAAIFVLAGAAVALLMRKDQRQDARIPTDVEVGITFAGDYHTARMRDISLSGARIAMRDAPAGRRRRVGPGDRAGGLSRHGHLAGERLCRRAVQAAHPGQSAAGRSWPASASEGRGHEGTRPKTKRPAAHRSPPAPCGPAGGSCAPPALPAMPAARRRFYDPVACPRR